MIFEMNVDGITVTVEQKRIKNMYLRVTAPAGAVRLSAPVSMSKGRMEAFVRDRGDWIRKKQQVYSGFRAAMFESGEVHCLWGRPLTLEVRAAAVGGGRAFVEGDKLVVEVRGAEEGRASGAGDRAAAGAKAGSDARAREALVSKLYREELAAAAAAALAAGAAIVGKSHSSFTIKNMKTRWGSCNVKTGRICFNEKLAQKPPICLEYVAIHELCHLWEAGHGPRFKALMDAFCPDWRSIKRLMNTSL